ncbi:MAG: transporter substrate-binding domain-containing protein [Alphaproteobacteria bacterium]
MKLLLLLILAVGFGFYMSEKGLVRLPADTKAPAIEAAGETAYQRIVRSGVVRCGYALWPPFLRKDPNTGQLSGFNHEIFNEIGKELGLKIEWVEEVGFGNYIEGLNAGRYDALCQTVWPDPGRYKNATITLPVHYHNVYVVVRSNDARFDQGYNKLNDAAFTTAAIDGDVTQSISRADFPNAKINALPQTVDATQLFLEVATGKADATFADYGFFKDYDVKNPGKLKTVGQVLHVYGSVFSVKQGEADLKNLIDSAIVSLTNKGILAAILKREDPASMPPAPTYAPVTP